jgi:hypothetical protein
MSVEYCSVPACLCSLEIEDAAGLKQGTMHCAHAVATKETASNEDGALLIVSMSANMSHTSYERASQAKHMLDLYP